jgi:hypothetical protein
MSTTTTKARTRLSDTGKQSKIATYCLECCVPFVHDQSIYDVTEKMMDDMPSLKGVSYVELLGRVWGYATRLHLA